MPFGAESNFAVDESHSSIIYFFSWSFDDGGGGRHLKVFPPQFLTLRLVLFLVKMTI